ncbi:hypothetical protein MLD38_028786 [Melastoma candidum]|uniref:Uncharacterized protein n=1 Tax=Melastoma candidum TaxID=119954 RepID=A0ACB9N2M5_9MYRT|nr:hypothetical protein MLD38_028786 [Melastoma candidum]
MRVPVYEIPALECVEMRGPFDEIPTLECMAASSDLASGVIIVKKKKAGSDGDLPDRIADANQKPSGTSTLLKRQRRLPKHVERPLIMFDERDANVRVENELKRPVGETQIPFIPIPMGRGLLLDSQLLAVTTVRSLAIEKCDVTPSVIIEEDEVACFVDGAKVMIKDTCHETFADFEGQKEFLQIGTNELFPSISVNIGSVVRMIKIEGDEKFRRFIDASESGVDDAKRRGGVFACTIYANLAKWIEELALCSCNKVLSKGSNACANIYKGTIEISRMSHKKMGQWMTWESGPSTADDICSQAYGDWGVAGLGCKNTLVYLLNHIWPDIIETSLRVINAIMEVIEETIVALGFARVLNYCMHGLFHPTRKHRVPNVTLEDKGVF